MSKLSYEDKIEIYDKRKKGITLKTLHLQYGIAMHNIQYIIWLVDKHGYEILKKKPNKYYPPYQKEEIINRVLIGGESITSVAIDIGLSSDGILHNWISKYKENGYNIVERKRGRSPTIMKKTNTIKKDETEKERIKRLEEENLYLKAELEYSKKLRAVVQARKNQQQKKK